MKVTGKDLLEEGKKSMFMRAVKQLSAEDYCHVLWIMMRTMSLMKIAITTITISKCFV